MKTNIPEMRMAPSGKSMICAGLRAWKVHSESTARIY